MDLQTRNAKPWQAGSYNAKTRSVRVVAATENPVAIYDYELGRVDEVLLMSGLKLPDNNQVPLCNSHSRANVNDVLGSARDFQTVDSQLECHVYFSDDTDGRDAESKVRDQHITDVSVGYLVSHSVFVPEGEKEFISGREFEGPLKVVTEWQIKELSLTPIGADAGAKIRSENHERNYSMLEKQEIEKIRNEERDRVSEISAMCTRHECEHIGQSLIENGASIEDARHTVMKFIDRTKVDPMTYEFSDAERERFSVGQSSGEKGTRALTDGLVLRSGVEFKNPVAGADDFRGISLIDAGRTTLELKGERVSRGASSNEIYKRAMTTSDFPYILASVAGKAARLAFLGAPDTSGQWTKVVDGKDFKEMSRVQMSESPSLEEVPEDTEIKYGSFSESREVYSMRTYAKIFPLSRQAIINDDLNMLTNIPVAASRRAKLDLDAACYAVLTGNSVMSDGVPLFHATHSNLASGGDVGAPSIATLTTARAAMRVQTGLKSTVLNIAPKFLIVPAALETTADQLLNTIEGFDASDGPGIHNPFYNKLTPVVSAVLDSGSTTAWYLVGDPGQIDTVEVCYLQGQRVPYVESKPGWSVDGIEFKIRFDWGVKALDHRGLYYNPGA